MNLNEISSSVKPKTSNSPSTTASSKTSDLIKQQSRTIKDLQTLNQNQKSQIQTLSSEKQKLTSAVQSLKQEVQSLSDRNQNVENKLLKANEELQSLNEKLAMQSRSDEILKDNERLKKRNSELRKEAETAQAQADSTQNWYYSKARALTEKEDAVERLKQDREAEIRRQAQVIADRQVSQIKDELESEHQKALHEFKEKEAALKEENDKTVTSAAFVLITAVLAIITALLVSDTMIADIITACKVIFHPVLVTGYSALVEISGVRNIVLFSVSVGLYIGAIGFVYEFIKQNIELFKPYCDDVTLFLITAFWLLSELIMTTFHFANIVGIWALACAVYLTLRIIITERKKKKHPY